jgi:type I restriction enzyme S subunit
MKRYEEYKESGVKWIGKVPSHWKDCRFKNFVSLVNFPSTDENKIGLENIESGTGRFIETESEFEGNGVEYIEDDIVYGKLRPYLRKVWLATNKGNAVGDFFVFRAKRSNASYVKWLMLSDGFTSETNGSTFGAKMPRVSSDFILSLHYFLPPLSEQQSIASFLDAKTKPIDAIISKREKQIELLEEMKSAIISRAVTKGLNPNAKMKDSGVEWIGEVPSHWDAIRLKFCGTIKSGDFLSKDNISDIGSVEVYGGNGFIGYTSRSNITPPAIIIGRVGALCGNVRLVTSEKWVSDNALVLHIQHKLIYQYTSLILQAVNLNRLNTSSAQPLITGSKIMNVFVPVPPLSEQHAIASYLDAETSKIDARIAKRRRQIALLQEYKQALITDAVTGKIDVREINS